MLPADVEHYVVEISRVMAKGGRCFCTAYIVNDQARDRLGAGTSVRKFERAGGYWTESRDNPEASLGYDEEYLRGLFERSGIEVTRALMGEWWTQPTAQDILIARKR